LFILITYSIVSAMVLFVVTAIVEVSAYLPVSGGTMGYYGHRNVSKSFGFAMGWLYWYSLAVCVPYEITAAGIVIEYWDIDVHIGIVRTTRHYQPFLSIPGASSLLAPRLLLKRSR
jgi:amino acid transporter